MAEYTPTAEQACEHCPDGHANPESRPWGVFVALERDGDGQPTHLYVAPTAGQHVAESDAEWARARLNAPGEPLALYGKRWLADRLAAHEAEVRERIARQLDAEQQRARAAHQAANADHFAHDYCRWVGHAEALGNAARIARGATR